MPQSQGDAPNWTRSVLVLPFVVALGLAGFLAFSVWSSIKSLDTARSDNTQWVYSQLEVEYLKLERALDRVQSGDTGALGELRKRFDVLYSRLEIAERMKSSVAAASELGRIRSELDQLIPIVDGDDSALLTNLETFRRGLHQIAGLPRDVALTSIAAAANAAEGERQRIVRLIEILAAVVFLVTLTLIFAVFRLGRQAKNLRTATHEAEENQLRLATTLRASLDAVVVIDENGLIRDYNGSAEEIFGFSRDEVLGRGFTELIVPEHLRDQQRQNLEHFRQTGETFFAESGRREYEMMTRDGRVFPVELSVSLARSDTGPLFVSYIRDITEKKHKEQEILQARDAALEAYREKSRFFAMMSHEMRTPLNGVLSALQLLEGSPLDKEQKGFLTAAIASGDILLGHINEVLAIERSETEGTERNAQPCDLAALTSGLLGMMEPLATSGYVRLHLDQQGLDDRLVLIDPRAIQQVLVNLINNAIKFAPGGDVTLKAYYRPSETNTGPDRACFEVIDTGEGISEADIPKIFEDFVSLDSRYERRTGGTGLGLGIARRLVRSMGGDIGCTSSLGNGAHFHFDVPIEMANTPAARSAEKAQRAAPPQRSSELLLVDDNEINRDLLSAMLKKLGHKVTLASGGQHGIDLASSTKFDAILMDISMPGVNGLQATQAIRSGNGPNTATPIIPVTAHALPAEKKEFWAAGMSNFIQKPIDMKALGLVLDAVLNEQSSGSAPLDFCPQAASTSVAYIDNGQVDQLIELLGRARLSERISKLVSKMDQELPAITEAADSEDLRAKSHAVAGMCGMFGATRLHAIFQEIEVACKTGRDRKARELVELLPDVWEETQRAWHHRVRQ
ncbi:Aerobic respiration control sensor protein ArcB [Pseudooceanicola marinus]|uniref:histidine kinase n=1 Tax=Pseudooceanicola marinus TaxID=396013 RepID=A0A1X6YUU2_9RHOB|nr:PAS domain-containing hybrid sensor histidine kinase/response regulator [Pseudooceanicola marinus]PJE26252.1 hybrid sensor histidine kinase/response regulator [Pseudooceanicola marinus]SLN31990.1 Aerobic respiration control sensor protein ArcB [Pseudooceanicola marinus]